LLSQIANRFRKVLRSRVVLEHPEDPEDTRVLNLFKNRAELKKELGEAQDDVHRLKDRVKLQEAATARVREQLEQLETRLAVPLSGLHTLVYYQLRELWASGHAQIAALLRELSQQREDRERRQFLADLNRQLFERSQAARADCAHAEHFAADARARHLAIQTQLARSQRWWQYFTRRDLARRLQAIVVEVAAAEDVLQQARQKLIDIEEQGGAKYPGLSLDARRMLNLTAIACAQVQALRLQPPGLLARMTDAMSRSEPRLEGAGEAQLALALMQEIARARAALMQNAPAVRADVRRLADLLAAAVKYRGMKDTVPDEDSAQMALRASLGRGEQMSWDLLGQDLWSISDLFYGLGD
jgi:hypothetical protein